VAGVRAKGYHNNARNKIIMIKNARYGGNMPPWRVFFCAVKNISAIGIANSGNSIYFDKNI
jgi:hypothetical protein